MYTNDYGNEGHIQPAIGIESSSIESIICAFNLSLSSIQVIMMNVD